jgi:hypothetical protein
MPFFDNRLFYNQYKDGMKEFNLFVRTGKRLQVELFCLHKYRRVEGQLYPFLTLALYGDEFLSHNVC